MWVMKQSGIRLEDIMPNLMLYGFPSEDIDQQLVLGMVEAMQSIGLGKEAIVTIVPSYALSCDGKQRAMPYIRVATTGDDEEVSRILAALKGISRRLDVEVLRLSRFIEAKDMA